MFVIFLLFAVIFFVAACTTTTVCNSPYINHGQSCCLDQDANAVCDSDENSSLVSSTVKQVDPNGTGGVSANSSSGAPGSARFLKNMTTLANEEDNLDYDLINKLQKKINQFTYNDASWIQMTKGSSYYDLGSQKLATLQMLSSPISNSDDFKNSFSGEGWKGNVHYLNSTAYDHLFAPRDESSFESASLYKKYSQEAIFIERYIGEQAIETPLGYVLEYQELNWKRDEYQFFKGEYQHNVLTYKIFCSPTLVVYLQPSRDDLDLNLLTSKMDNAQEVWDQNVVRLRPEMLQKAQKIMQECPNTAAMTKTLRGSTYQKQIVYADHLPTYLYYYWDMNIKIDPEIHRSERNTQKNAIDRVSVTFSNDDAYDVTGPILVDIRVKPDGNAEEYLVRDKKLVGNFASGTSINRVFIPFEPIEFDTHAVIEVRMYTENGGHYIRPQQFVLNY